MEVIKTVLAGCFRCLVSSGSCLLQLLFLVGGIQQTDICQISYIFILPSGRILSAYWKLGCPVERTVRLQASWMISMVKP